MQTFSSSKDRAGGIEAAIFELITVGDVIPDMSPEEAKFFCGLVIVLLNLLFELAVFGNLREVF